MASMKERVLHVPVLGYLLRWCASVVLLPCRITALQTELAQKEEQLQQMRQRMEAAEQQMHEDRIEVQRVQMFGEEQDRFYEHMHLLEGKPEELLRLKTALSGSSTLWGDPARLHISPKAAVDACLFNTNSGEITVGDYTFSGSNVSILAGSHDQNLTGLLRRDLPLDSGCDIVIGNGVWLASGCTLLGPCTVGDNAVIAAGSVVLPGTVVPKNTTYGGIPAKCLRELKQENQFSYTESFFAQEVPPVPDKETSIALAFERTGGVLFTKGWYDEKPLIYKDKTIFGHWMADPILELYIYAPQMLQKQLRMLCITHLAESAAQLKIRCDEKEFTQTVHGECQELCIPLPESAKVRPVRIQMEWSGSVPFDAVESKKILFFSLLPEGEKERREEGEESNGKCKY